MKKPFLLFALKFTVILYFAACTGINDYTTAVSATPYVTKGLWKINLLADNISDNTSHLSGYTFIFDPLGTIVASKNGVEVKGNWSEDDILKRITINLDTNDPVLKKLNDQWNIFAITKAGLSLQNTENPAAGRLQITSL